MMTAQVSKTDEFCVQKHEDIVFKTRNSVLKTMNFVFKTMNFVFKMINCADGSHGLHAGAKMMNFV